MLISIVNLSRGALPDEDLQRVIRAVNRQIAEDFEPYWSPHPGDKRRFVFHAGTLARDKGGR
jgi:hypothetical protein